MPNSKVPTIRIELFKDDHKINLTYLAGNDKSTELGLFDYDAGLNRALKLVKDNMREQNK